MAKVAMLCYGDEGYGIQRVVIDISTRMPEVEIIVLRKGGLYEAARSKGIQTIIVPGLEQEGGYQVSLLWFLRRSRKLIRESQKLRQFCLDRDIRILHTHIFPLHLLASLACFGMDVINSVWHFHVIPGKNRYGFLTRTLHKIIGLFLADRIIAVSEATAKPYRSKLRDHVRRIYNGITQPPPLNSPAAKSLRTDLHTQYKVVLCWAGRLIYSKGLHIAIEALGESSDADIGLIVLGDTDDPSSIETGYRQFLYSIVEKYDLRDRVQFLGRVNNVLEYMFASDIVVHTRLDAEPCSMVIIEGLSLGRVVIATSTGGTPELIKDGVDGFLVRPGSVGDLTRTIKILIDNKTLCGMIGENARETAKERFSIIRVVKEVKQVYEELFLKP